MNSQILGRIRGNKRNFSSIVPSNRHHPIGSQPTSLPPHLAHKLKTSKNKLLLSERSLLLREYWIRYNREKNKFSMVLHRSMIRKWQMPYRALRTRRLWSPPKKESYRKDNYKYQSLVTAIILRTSMLLIQEMKLWLNTRHKISWLNLTIDLTASKQLPN